MTIELSYKYSELDKCHQFGIEFKDLQGWEIYARWVFFYLGVNFGKRHRLYPYNVGKVIKEYKNCNDAERQAKLLYNRITKIKQ